MQVCSDTSVLAMELLQSCTKPLTWCPGICPLHIHYETHIMEINLIFYASQAANLNNLWAASNEMRMQVSVLNGTGLPVSTL